MMQIARPPCIVSHSHFEILCAQTMTELPLHVSRTRYGSARLDRCSIRHFPSESSPHPKVDTAAPQGSPKRGAELFIIVSGHVKLASRCE
jgi:hypothetical protein